MNESGALAGPEPSSGSGACAGTSPEYVQTSTAAAMTLKFLPGRFHRGAKLCCLNLLVTYDDDCRAKCAYCGLSGAREVSPEDRTFIRVDWPILKVDDIIERAKAHAAHVQRVCVSMITHPRAFGDMNTIIGQFRDNTDLLISALIGPTLIRSKEMVQEIRDAGADTVGVAIDAATPGLFEKFRGKGVKGPHRWDHYWKVLEWCLEVFGEFNVTTHMIVGIGETEREFLDVVQRSYDMGVDTHLFSFFPEQGSRMQDLAQPSYGNYRRVQLGRYIITQGIGRIDGMTFDEKGQVRDFGVAIEPIIDSGEAFMTSGCPGKDGKVACNRPFGNERPSKPIRNFPFLPNEEDKGDIRGQLREYF